MLFEEAFSVRDKIKDCAALKKWNRELRENAQKLLCEETVQLKLSDFMLYYKSGERASYEKKYFSRRARLAAFALMVFIYRDKEYILPLEDVIWEICGEFTWCLPAHIPENAYDEYLTRIDLFSAETGFALSEIKYILSKELSDRVKDRIHKAVKERIIKAFSDNNNRPQRWENWRNNWVSVCAAGIGAACLYEGTESEKERLIKETIKLMDRYLSGFSEDGICTEGLDYWNYGFGFFSAYAQLLFQYTDGEENLFQDKRARKTAEFLNYGVLRNGLPIMFSDIKEGCKPNMGNAYFLNAKYENVQLTKNVYAGYNDDHCYRWVYRIRDAVWTAFYENTARFSESKKEMFYYFRTAQWYIQKNKKFILCAKGGTNDEMHNHNDVGSFFADNYKTMIFADLGAGEYDSGYFDERLRYEYLTNSSRGHNVPIINGKYQQQGKKYCAEVKKYCAENILMELKNAYDEPKLKSYTRNIKTDENTITINDLFSFSEGNNTVTERFVTKVKPTVCGDRLFIGNCEITTNGASCRIKKERYITHMLKEDTVYIIDFEKNVEKRWNFDIKITFG